METVSRWLILRGLAREMRQWGRFPDLLEDRLGAPVDRLDLPGIGSAKDRRTPATVEDTVEDLRERLSQLPATSEGPVGILGLSLGGMVALSWAAAYPAEVGAAVVVNSSAGDLSFPESRFRLSNLPTLLRAGRARDLVERELTVLGITTTNHGENRAIAEEWASYRKEHPLEVKTSVRQLVAGLRFRSPENLEVPTLFVSGAGDRFVAPRCTARLAEKFGAEHAQHPTGGHDLSLDAPEWLVDRVATFVDRLAVARVDGAAPQLSGKLHLAATGTP